MTDDALHHLVRVRREGGEVTVSVPEDAEDLAPPSPKLARESIKVQALLAKIGAVMGFRVWIPANDRAGVLREQPSVESSLLEQLPLDYDSTTIKTIENIDVLWLKGRSMARAFEVEHTTAIYSGILRMADLLALQPNMDIRLHIVGPDDRRRKVFEEIRRHLGVGGGNTFLWAIRPTHNNDQHEPYAKGASAGA